MPVTPIVTCEHCKQRCDGKSLGRYPRQQYYAVGENQEAIILKLIQSNAKGLLTCQKSAMWGEAHSKPDLELRSIGQPSKIVGRLEVKHIRRAWMQVGKCLEEGGLVPWETIAVNTAKIRRYAKLYEQEGIPIHLVWRIDRACLPGRFFYQDIGALTDIVERHGNKREFVREGDDGDKTAFHYSVNELKPFNVDEYLDLLFTLSRTVEQKSWIVSDKQDYPEYEFTDDDVPPEHWY